MSDQPTRTVVRCRVGDGCGGTWWSTDEQEYHRPWCPAYGGRHRNATEAPVSDQPTWTVDENGNPEWDERVTATVAPLFDETRLDDLFAAKAALVRAVTDAARLPDIEPRLAAALTCIRRLRDGWEPLGGQWRNEAECDWDGVAVRYSMTPDEAAVLALAAKEDET